MADDVIPRRIRVDLMTPAELAIRHAMLAVENVGADVLLTDAVNLLQQAREKVADYVDGRQSQGWEWTHDHHAKLIGRDGLMCEQHPGVEWPHDSCAGPGQAWAVEGKQSIVAMLKGKS